MRSIRQLGYLIYYIIIQKFLKTFIWCQQNLPVSMGTSFCKILRLNGCVSLPILPFLACSFQLCQWMFIAWPTTKFYLVFLDFEFSFS